MRESFQVCMLWINLSKNFILHRSTIILGLDVEALPKFKIKQILSVAGVRWYQIYIHSPSPFISFTISRSHNEYQAIKRLKSSPFILLSPRRKRMRPKDRTLATETDKSQRQVSEQANSQISEWIVGKEHHTGHCEQSGENRGDLLQPKWEPFLDSSSNSHSHPPNTQPCPQLLHSSTTQFKKSRTPSVSICSSLYNWWHELGKSFRE